MIDSSKGDPQSPLLGKRFDYKNYLLLVLACILAFNYVDRLALGLVLQNIKTDLHLSDTQLGFLSGIAFALFYSILGIPIGRLADRGNRVTIISVTAALWSAMVMLCGRATSFLQLLLIRIGVGVGEAGCMPPAYSLIADYFDRAERPRALAIYFVGGSLSTVIGYSGAGWLSELYGWRTMFLLVGLPGALLAAIAWLTLREPRLRPSNNSAGDTLAPPKSPSAEISQHAPPPHLLEVFRVLWGTATFRHLMLCLSVTYFFSYGIAQWQPAFFIRRWGLPPGQLGTWFAVTAGFGGMLGTYLGGYLASRYAPRNERLQLKGVALVLFTFGVISALVYLSPNYHLAFAFLGASSLGGTLSAGPMFAAMQGVVPQRMRALSVAITFLFANLIGLGLGPLAVGALSDWLRPLVGSDSLRYALLAICPGFMWAVWHAWRASKSVTLEVQAVAEDHRTSDRNEFSAASVRIRISVN